MPLFGPIPISDPRQGFSDIAELLMKNKLTREQMRQFNEQMAIQKAEEKRKQDMFPYLLQKAQQEQNLADRMYKEFFGEEGNNTQESTPISQQPGINSPKSLPQNSNKMMNNMSMLQQFIDSGQAKPEDIEQINQFMGSQGGQPNSGQTPFAPMPEAMNMPRKDIIALANQRAANAPNMGTQVPNQVVNQVPIQNKTQKFEPEKMGYGEEITIKQPDKMKAAWDKFPGQTVAGFKIPDLKPPVIQDGIEYQQWPSGKITATKVGKSEQEKADIAVKKAEGIAQNKANIERTKNIEKTSDTVDKFMHHIATIGELFEKNKHVTGPIKGRVAGLGWSSKDMGTFMAATTPMIGSLAKELSERGGAVASGLASLGKPSPTQNQEANEAINEELAREAYRVYHKLKQEYEELNPGKTYKGKLPAYFRRVRIKDPNGNTYIKSESEAIKFKEEHPELEILGNIYAEE